jgi:hypothetical protein
MVSPSKNGNRHWFGFPDFILLIIYLAYSCLFLVYSCTSSTVFHCLMPCFDVFHEYILHFAPVTAIQIQSVHSVIPSLISDINFGGFLRDELRTPQFLHRLCDVLANKMHLEVVYRMIWDIVKDSVVQFYSFRISQCHIRPCSDLNASGLRCA